tara:strand:- start:443 stop:754 length:312 start_codon:yes stop_codon:yes gene_type:complete
MARNQKNRNQKNRNQRNKSRRNRNRNRKQRGGMFATALESLALPASFFLAHKAVQKKRLPRAVKKTLKRGTLSLKGGNKSRKNRNNKNTRRNRKNRNNKNRRN